MGTLLKKSSLTLWEILLLCPLTAWGQEKTTLFGCMDTSLFDHMHRL